MSGPFVTSKAKVTPARISPAVWPLTRAPRNPKSTAILSWTCQIAPMRAEPVSKHANIALIKEFGDRSHGPVMWTLDDTVEKVVDMLLAGELKLRVEVDRSPVPALRDDAV